MPAPEEKDPTAAAAAEEKAAEQQREIAESHAKLAEKLEATAQQVASIAQAVAERPATAAAAAQPVQAPQRLTEEQVAALIESKHITFAQGMQYLNRLAREDAKAEARAATNQALAEVGKTATEHQTAALIAQYKKAIPGLDRRGSPEWNEVAQRYQELLAENYPHTIQTELTALREVYGRDPSKARESAGEPREHTKQRATRGDETPSSASARGGSPRRSRESGPDPELSSDQRAYVEHLISIGQYKGWDDERAKKYIARAKEGSPRQRRRAS